MKKDFQILLLFCFISFYSIGQNSIYIGSEKYKSTATWSFKNNGDWMQGPVEVSIGKKSNGGIIMISIKSFQNEHIKGNLMIYLDDGSVIKCLDKGIYDAVDNKSIAVYYLTPSEIELLKNSDISSIRFSIINDIRQTINQTADNSYETDLPSSMFPSQYKTASSVSNLFR